MTTTITVKEGGEVITETKQVSGTHDNVHDSVVTAGQNEITDISEQEAECYAIASDLANVCEYLNDAEVIKIRLIIQKAEARRQREEGAT